jgi:hypothetical protein
LLSTLLPLKASFGHGNSHTPNECFFDRLWSSVIEYRARDIKHMTFP